MNTTNEAQRELKIYEYQVQATPQYCSPIEEGWEIVDVFIKWLANGNLNYLLVFRKQISRYNIGTPTVQRSNEIKNMDDKQEGHAHKFVFSHASQEGMGYGTDLLRTFAYVICESCGKVLKQEIDTLDKK